MTPSAGDPANHGERRPDCGVHVLSVHRLDQRRLKRIFAGFILLVGLFTAASATGLIPIRIK
jgi:hypothetical protein